MIAAAAAEQSHAFAIKYPESPDHSIVFEQIGLGTHVEPVELLIGEEVDVHVAHRIVHDVVKWNQATLSLEYRREDPLGYNVVTTRTMIGDDILANIEVTRVSDGEVRPSLLIRKYIFLTTIFSINCLEKICESKIFSRQWLRLSISA